MPSPLRLPGFSPDERDALTQLETGMLIRNLATGNAEMYVHGVGWAPILLIPPTTVQSSQILSGQGPGSSTLTVLDQDPTAPQDNTAWLTASGASPSVALKLRARLSGKTVTLAETTVDLS